MAAPIRRFPAPSAPRSAPRSSIDDLAGQSYNRHPRKIGCRRDGGGSEQQRSGVTPVERQLETIEAEGVESLLDLLGKELVQPRMWVLNDFS
jgi:hypothetical protein